jgi:hypothetical protein
LRAQVWRVCARAQTFPVLFDDACFHAPAGSPESETAHRASFDLYAVVLKGLSLQHPALLLYFGHCLDNGVTRYAVTEPHSDSLSQYLTTVRPLALPHAVSLLCQILRGLCYLHSTPTPSPVGSLSLSTVLVMRGRLGEVLLKLDPAGSPLREVDEWYTCPCGSLPTPACDMYAFGLIAAAVASQYMKTAWRGTLSASSPPELLCNLLPLLKPVCPLLAIVIRCVPLQLQAQPCLHYMWPRTLAASVI